MKVPKFLLALSAAVAVLVATARPADAVFRMRIEDLNAGVGAVVTDGGAGDGFGVLGVPNDVILFSGTVGSFLISIQVGTASPGSPMAGYHDALDLNSVSVMTTGSGTLRIILEKDGMAAAPDGNLVLQSSAGGVSNTALGSTVTFQGWGNDDNLVPALGPDQVPGAIAPLSLPPAPAGSVATPTMTFGPGAFHGTVSALLPKTGTYSLFSQSIINMSGPGTLTFDHTTGTNPAPAGLVLLAAGLPCLAFGYYRRKKAAVPA